ncbi:hypothetical protein NW765_012670 [Fusarium oxysporum]|nr:hypothetical protein NW765_012670 [Fusarium oxysporum]
MTAGAPPNYYAILEVSDTATTQQIRDAYKRAALKTHPDRVSNDSPERAERTRKFQLVNDAYYTLSDPVRRREYDAQRKLFNTSTPSDPFEDIPETETEGGAAPRQSPYSWAWNFFTNQGQAPAQDREQTEDAQFSDVFEEMMREEGMAEGRDNHPHWQVLEYGGWCQRRRSGVHRSQCARSCRRSRCGEQTRSCPRCEG